MPVFASSGGRTALPLVVATVGVGAGTVLLASCGRSSLDAIANLRPSEAEGSDAGAVPSLLPMDAGMEVPPNSPSPSSDASTETLLPTLDADASDDASPASCLDADTPSIFVVTSQKNLLRFDSPTAAFTLVGALACPTSGQPQSMAVDRNGVAYVSYGGSGLFRVSTLTASCERTPFVTTSPFTSIGMTFLDGTGSPPGTLYVASCGTPFSLGTIDLTSFQVAVVGRLSLYCAELTSTPDGRLFGLSGYDLSSSITQIDPSTAQAMSTIALPTLALGSGWAIGYSGGDFYLFTAPPSAPVDTTVVNRYRPADGSLTQVASLGEKVAGAGVSSCAAGL
jgi:hypothetical protein